MKRKAVPSTTPGRAVDLEPDLMEDLSSVIERCAALADPPVLVAAVSDLLQKAWPRRESAREAYGRALARGLVARREMEEAEGGSVSSDQAARLLGMSKPSVLKRFEKGQLLGWRDQRQKAVRLPIWQFSDQGMIAGLDRILEVLRRTPLDDWGRVSFFLEKRESLGGLSPLEVLRQGRLEDVERVCWGEVE